MWKPFALSYKIKIFYFVFSSFIFIYFCEFSYKDKLLAQPHTFLACLQKGYYKKWDITLQIKPLFIVCETRYEWHTSVLCYNNIQNKNGMLIIRIVSRIKTIMIVMTITATTKIINIYCMWCFVSVDFVEDTTARCII